MDFYLEYKSAGFLIHLNIKELNIILFFFCRGSQPSKTVDNNYAKQSSHTKEKERDDDGISLVMSDAQPKGLCTLEICCPLNFYLLHF